MQVYHKGKARTQSPTIKNYAFELPTFGVIVGVNQTEVQWKGLTLEEPPSWSWLTSTPGKYALFEFELSSCPNHQGFSRWETLLYVFNHDFEYELGCRCKQIVSHIAKNGENFSPGENKRGKTFDSCCTLWSVKCNIKCDSSVVSALFFWASIGRFGR